MTVVTKGRVGILLAGRYRLDGHLGRGATADVWRGTDQLLDRPVAIKILDSVLAADESYLERFRGEARIAASLSHTGITAVHDVGEASLFADGSRPVPYLVMELVEGPSVAQLLAGGALGTDHTVRLIAAAARALDVAHGHGVVHRDVKPANLMLTAQNQVKVADFGIARRAGNVPLTTTGQLVGTPEYLAPEVIRGRPASPQSDVYALGIIAYECLTGRRPFRGGNQLAILTAHVNQAPPPLPTDVPVSVAAAVTKAMDKDPSRRHSSAAAFADALEQTGDDRAAAEPTVWFSPLPQSSPGSGEFTRPTSIGDPFTGTAPGPQRTRHGRFGLPHLAVALMALGVVGLGAGPGSSALTGAFPDLFGRAGAAAPATPTAAPATRVVAGATPAAAGAVTVGGPTGASVAAVAGSGVPTPTTRVSAPTVAAVPDVRGRTPASARTELHEAGLLVRDTVEVDAPGVSRGRVVRTDPPAGRRVPSGSRVTVYVSNGRVTVPDLAGRTVDDAVNILQNRLRMTVLLVYKTPYTVLGTVVGQDIRGSGVRIGTVVTLTIAGQVDPSTGQTTPAPKETAVTGKHW